MGHGVGCGIDGGRITLLTSIWFRCQGATSLTDAAGPFASLIAGLAAFGLLPIEGTHRVARFVLILFGAISLFWFAAQLIGHAATNGDDWAIIARRNHWPSIWRPIFIAVGIATYAGAMAQTATTLRRKVRPDGRQPPSPMLPAWHLPSSPASCGSRRRCAARLKVS